VKLLSIWTGANGGKGPGEKVRQNVSAWFTKFIARVLLTAFVFFTGPFFSLPLVAQQQGPLSPPPPRAGAPEAKPSEMPVTPTQSPSGISNEPPSLPVDQIIQSFAERESEFKTERDNYTYVQTFVVQTIGDNGLPDGEYRLTSDILFTTSGKRYENVTYAPPPTLQRISLSEQDLDDLKNVQPFVLTTEELPKYNITYVGRAQVDFVSTYVFDVAPKKIDKKQRYFQGRIWVDDKDLEIVKTYGKAVPDLGKAGNENVFPRFETFRENIEGNYWFPTYTRADDYLHYSLGDVHIRMTVRYADYKRFGSTIRIIAVPQQPKPDKP
jgi:hypothetical protein